jgi:hypothetical protein
MEIQRDIAVEHAYPRTAPLSERLRFLTRYAQLAPSGHNTQPWRFDVDDDGAWLYAEAEYALDALDPGARELIMSCGAALFHLRAAMRHYGLVPAVTLLPRTDDTRERDGAPESDATESNASESDAAKSHALVPTGPLARITAPTSQAATLRDERLFTAIKQRRTHRGDFAGDPVPDTEVDELVREATNEGVVVHVVRADADRQRVSDLVDESVRRMLDDPSVRSELSAWSRFGSGAEGVPGSARGWGRVKTAAAPFWMRLPGIGLNPWNEEARQAREAPVLVILGTATDAPPDLLRAGQGLDRLLLRATSYGLGASFLNQPIKVPSCRDELAELLPGDVRPQIVLRLGKASESGSATGRRSATPP